MKFIQLSQGQQAIVDDDCPEFILDMSWYAKRATVKSSFYAVSKSMGQKGVRLHNLILQPPHGMVVDHINRNSLDNRRANLRLCTKAQNCQNRRSLGIYRGVCYKKAKKKWQARIMVNGRSLFLGYFSSPQHAALAYNIRAIGLHGEFAVLNPLNK